MGYNYTFDLKSFPITEVKIQRKVKDIISKSVHSYLKEHSPFVEEIETNPNMLTDLLHTYCVCGKRFENIEASSVDFNNNYSDKFTMLQLHQISEVRRHLQEDECITNDNKFVYHNLERIP